MNCRKPAWRGFAACPGVSLPPRNRPSSRGRPCSRNTIGNSTRNDAHSDRWVGVAEVFRELGVWHQVEPHQLHGRVSPGGSTGQYERRLMGTSIDWSRSECCTCDPKSVVRLRRPRSRTRHSASLSNGKPHGDQGSYRRIHPKRPSEHNLRPTADRHTPLPDKCPTATGSVHRMCIAAGRTVHGFGPSIRADANRASHAMAGFATDSVGGRRHSTTLIYIITYSQCKPTGPDHRQPRRSDSNVPFPNGEHARTYLERRPLSNSNCRKP